MSCIINLPVTEQHKIGIKYEPFTLIVYIYTKISIVVREKSNEIKTISFYTSFICYINLKKKRLNLGHCSLTV